MGRQRKTEAEQGIDQVNRRGPSSQPTQTEAGYERRKLVLQKGRGVGSVCLHVYAADLSITLLGLAAAPLL